MRTCLLTMALAFFSLGAQANPALHGTWSGMVDGDRVVVVFSPGGTGSIDGEAMRWRSQGNTLLVEQDGGTASYTFRVGQDGLRVSGESLGGTVVFTRLASRKGAASAGNRSGGGGELVGKWCQGGGFSANAGGGSSSMTCFELRRDGSYVYQTESSMSAYAPGAWGGTSSQSGDAGSWSVSGNRLTARSRSGEVNTYTLEKRNNKRREPMLCLDGECYTTYWQRAPW